MIVAVDHTVIVCPALASAAGEMSSLLGRGPVWTARTREVETALFLVDNTALELVAPAGAGAQADRLRQIVDIAGGPALTSLVFASDDLSGDHRRFSRRKLDPGGIHSGSSHDLRTGATRRWKRFRLSDESMAGIKTFVIQPPSERLTPPEAAADQVHSLDHLVVSTTHPQRAVATYGGRLGLNLALDLTEQKWGVRLLFFRVGGLTLEFAHKRQDPPTPQDRLWGLTWAVNDLSAAKARLEKAGVATSEIRVGRKPGSSVFTVKSHSLGVPTLFIAHQPRTDS